MLVISLFVQIPVGILLAYLLYSKVKGMKLYRTIFFLPVVIAPVAISLMFSLFYNSEIGVFNKILEAIGLGRFATNWLSNIHTLLYSVMDSSSLAVYRTLRNNIFGSASVYSARIDRERTN